MKSDNSLSKEELEIILRQNIDFLMHGTSAEFKKAKKEITRLYHYQHDNFKAIAPIVFEYIDKFDSIEKWQNKAAFISGIDLFFLTLSDDYFKKLKDFTIKAIQNPNGAVRKAIENVTSWLYISITDRAEPFIYKKSKKNDEDIELAKKQLIDFVNEVEGLIEKYDDDSDKGEYVNDMRPSICKSLNVLWDKLTYSGIYRKLQETSNPVPSEIFFMRKEIESEIADLLKRSKSFASLDTVKNIIYNESSTEDLHFIFTLFDTGVKNGPEVFEYLEIINDAWNYFPHKCLNGMCPAEVSDNYAQ